MSSVAETDAAFSALPVIDVEAIFAPLPGGAGVPPSEALYAEILEARRADAPSTATDPKHKRKVSDWDKTLRLATDALKTGTKDLRICGWMAEALVYRYGFPGLRDGLKVVRGLHESLWDDLYPPKAEDDDLEARANIVAKMGDWIAVALNDVPLTEEQDNGTAYNYYDWSRANLLRSSKSETDTAKGSELSEIWLKATRATPIAFYETNYLSLEECWTEFEALARVMSERYGNQNGGTGKLRETLENIRGLIGSVLGEKRRLEPAAAPAVSPKADGRRVASRAGRDGFASRDAGQQSASPVAVSGAITTRQEAIRQLQEVASFFRQTEPQSPVAYLVERAIKWSDMPLEEWLESVVKNKEVLGFIRETLGVEPPEAASPTSE